MLTELLTATIRLKLITNLRNDKKMGRVSFCSPLWDFCSHNNKNNSKVTIHLTACSALLTSSHQLDSLIHRLIRRNSEVPHAAFINRAVIFLSHLKYLQHFHRISYFMQIFNWMKRKIEQQLRCYKDLRCGVVWPGFARPGVISRSTWFSSWLQELFSQFSCFLPSAKTNILHIPLPSGDRGRIVIPWKYHWLFKCNLYI